MRFISLLGFSLSAFATSGAAINDLDPSVWKSLQGEQSSANTVFERQSRNRPVKRADGWNPPANLAAPLKQVWDHVEKTYDGGVKGNINWTWQQIMANKGFLNVCVRWDSSSKVTAAEREKIITAYKAQYQKWFKWLYGFDGFPYSNIDINIVGWAVRDKSLFEGTANYPVYSTTKDPDGVPACDIGCSRDAHMDGDYSKCNGGFDKHFDQSLWLTDGLEGGFGYSWGQQVGKEYMLNNLGSSNIHILLHEMGHGFGLDDFYDWTPTGVSKFIMLAGASMEITDFDGWMFRNWWYELNKIHKWVSSTGSSSTSPSAAASAQAKPTTTTKAAIIPAPTKAAAVTTTKAAVKPTANAGSSATLAQKWQQCGGSGYTGPTACVSGSTCVKSNQFYSQCL